MGDYHFISYSKDSSLSVLNFALELYDELGAGPPPFKCWLDERDLKPGEWDRQIPDAIVSCKSFL